MFWHEKLLKIWSHSVVMLHQIISDGNPSQTWLISQQEHAYTVCLWVPDDVTEQQILLYVFENGIVEQWMVPVTIACWELGFGDPDWGATTDWNRYSIKQHYHELFQHCVESQAIGMYFDWNSFSFHNTLKMDWLMEMKNSLPYTNFLDGLPAFVVMCHILGN